MKLKILSLFLLSAMLLSLLSCGDKKPGDDPNTPTAPETSTEPEREKVSIAFESQSVPIGYVEDTDVWRSVHDVVSDWYDPEIPEYYREPLARYDETFFEENVLVCVRISLFYDPEGIEATGVYKYVAGDAEELMIDMRVVATSGAVTDAETEWTVFIALDKDIEIDEDKIVVKWVDGQTLSPEQKQSL